MRTSLIELCAKPDLIHASLIELCAKPDLIFQKKIYLAFSLVYLVFFRGRGSGFSLMSISRREVGDPMMGILCRGKREITLTHVTLSYLSFSA